MRSSGTGWPSLYRSGSRISWRRSDLLIRRGALDLESYVLGSQEAQRPLRDEHLARRPALEGKSTGEAAQCPFLGVQVGEADPDHEISLSPPKADGNGRAGRRRLLCTQVLRSSRVPTLLRKAFPQKL